MNHTFVINDQSLFQKKKQEAGSDMTRSFASPRGHGQRVADINTASSPILSYQNA